MEKTFDRGSTKFFTGLFSMKDSAHDLQRSRSSKAPKSFHRFKVECNLTAASNSQAVEEHVPGQLGNVILQQIGIQS